MSFLNRLRRGIAEYLYTERRHVFRMLRSMGFPFRKSFLLCAFSLAEYKGYFRESGLRLMLYREHRDRADVFSECYFGRNYLAGPVECVVDVGAHAGSYSWACYKLLRPRKMYLYEPNSDLVARLESLAREMPDAAVIVRNVAVGESRTRVVYHKAENALLSSPLAFSERERGLLKEYDQSISQSVEVDQATLDDELRGLARIDFLKIDTQGYEMSVLRGARNTLAKTRVVMVESNFLSLYADGSTFPQVHQFLNEAGFLLVQLDAPSRSNGVYVWTDALYVARALV